MQPDTVLRVSVDDGVEEKAPSVLRARSRRTSIERLVDRRPSYIEPLMAARRQGEVYSLSPPAWTIDEVAGPNASDKETVLTFAIAAGNAYVMEPGTGEWDDVGGGLNYSESFGWEGDGLRGHIFVDKDNTTVLMALKGTSPGMPPLHCYSLQSLTTWHFQLYGMAPKPQQMTKSTITCFSAVAVLNRVTTRGNKSATAIRQHTPVIQHA